MSLRNFAACGALALAVSGGAALMVHAAPQPAPAQRGAARGPLTHDATGLQRELQPFLDTFAASVSGLGQTLAVFIIPNAEGWFAAHFPKDTAPGLENDQRSAIASYEQGLLTQMYKWPEKTHFRVTCVKQPGGASVPLVPRPGRAMPINDVGVESYQCTFAASADSRDEQRTFVNVANFVWVNGAYRFAGTGFYPFWAMPAPAAQ